MLSRQYASATDFPRQKPRQFASAEANFEGLYIYVYIAVLYLQIFSSIIIQ